MCFHANKSGCNFPKSYRAIYSRRAPQSQCFSLLPELCFPCCLSSPWQLSSVFPTLSILPLIILLILLCSPYLPGETHPFQMEVLLIYWLSLQCEFPSVSPSETPRGFEEQFSEEMLPGKRTIIWFGLWSTQSWTNIFMTNRFSCLKQLTITLLWAYVLLVEMSCLKVAGMRKMT